MSRNKVNMELQGIDQLMKRVEELGKRGATVENKALREAGRVMAEEMQKEVPIDTGKLKESIKVSKIRTSKGIKRIEVGPNTKTAWRAKFVEFGTSKMSANPFMSRSYETNKDKIQSTIINELKKGLGL